MPIYQCSAQKGLLTRGPEGEDRRRHHRRPRGGDRSTAGLRARVLQRGAARYLLQRRRTRHQDLRDHRIDPRRRTLEQKQKLIKQIVASWTEITGQPANQLIAGLTEIDPEVEMEYGLILPRPGDEPAWFADNAAALDGIQGTGL